MFRSVRTAAIPAFGAIVENVTDKMVDIDVICCYFMLIPVLITIFLRKFSPRERDAPS